MLLSASRRTIAAVVAVLFAGSLGAAETKDPRLRLQLPEGDRLELAGVAVSPDTLIFAADLGLTPLQVEVWLGDDPVQPRAVQVDPYSSLVRVVRQEEHLFTPMKEAPAKEISSWVILGPQGDTAPVELVAVRSLPGIGEALEFETHALAPGVPLVDGEGRLAALALFPLNSHRWIALSGRYLENLKTQPSSSWAWPGALAADDWRQYQQGLRDFYSGNPEQALNRLLPLQETELGGPEVKFLLASILAELGKGEDSIQKAAAVLQSEPEHAGALALAGALFFSIESYPRAEDLCRHSLERLPRLPECHGIIATVRLIDGDDQSALDRFKELVGLSVSPLRQGFGWLGIGNALAGLDRPKEALDAFGHARAASSPGVADGGWAAELFGDRASLDAGLTLSEARALVKLERWKEAVERLDPVLRDNPAFATAEVRVQHAEALCRLGRWPEAAEVLEQATHQFPQSPEAFHWLGVAYSWLGRWPEASAALHSADQIRPDDAETLYLWAVSLLRQNRLDEAQAVRERLASINLPLATQLAQIIARHSPR